MHSPAQYSLCSLQLQKHYYVVMDGNLSFSVCAALSPEMQKLWVSCVHVHARMCVLTQGVSV